MTRKEFKAFEPQILFSRKAQELLLAASAEFRKVLHQRAIAIAKKPESGAERIIVGERETVMVGPEDVRQALVEMDLEYLTADSKPG